MGFLDHSTNNIIIDAVLTDTGRRLLADNQGRFEISFFSMGDDEVDYSIIRKFGRAVGKEKISKNTPVFEAQTRESQALKYRLLTLPDPTVAYIPRLNLVLEGSDGQLVTLDNAVIAGSDTAANQKKLTFRQQMLGAPTTQVPAGIGDVTFTVLVPDRFIQIQNSTPVSKDNAYASKLAYYELNGTTNTANGGGELEITLTTQSGMTSETFSIYGDADNSNTITTQISVIGTQSGIRKDVSVKVLKG